MAEPREAIGQGHCPRETCGSGLVVCTLHSLRGLSDPLAHGQFTTLSLTVYAVTVFVEYDHGNAYYDCAC